jgi:polyisoprenoid-binding protein YceI
MKKLPATMGSLAVIAALTCAATPAAQPAPRLVPAQSQIAFVSKQMGVPVEGSFKKFDAQIAFDPHKPEGGTITFAIDTASASLGVPEADAELPKASWFSTARFPLASFQSTAIKGLGGGRFEVAGKLSIKGNVREVVVPVAIVQAGPLSTASGSFALKRLEFKVGDDEWTDTTVIANDVLVKFKLTMTGLGPL